MSLYQTIVSIITSLERSKPTNARKPDPLVFSTYNGGLVDPGTGIFADRLGPPQDDSTNGLFVFGTEECTGLDFDILVTGALGVTTNFRLCTAVCLNPGAESADQHWTFRHLYDGAAIGSAQTGIAGGVFGTGVRHGTVSLVGDGGLAPLGTRIMQGTAVNSASRLIADQVCWPRVCVQVSRTTATSVSVLAGRWTRN